MWPGPANTIMLRADVEPFYSPALPDCTVFVDASGPPRNPGCVRNPSGSAVAFASDQALFYSTFQSAWHKMVDFESTNLTLIVATVRSAAACSAAQLVLTLIAFLLSM